MEDLINKLENWKFEDAYKLSKNLSLTSTQHGLIRCLATSYSNCGWFEGEAGKLIGSVVTILCRNLEGR